MSGASKFSDSELLAIRHSMVSPDCIREMGGVSDAEWLAAMREGDKLDEMVMAMAVVAVAGRSLKSMLRRVVREDVSH